MCLVWSGCRVGIWFGGIIGMFLHFKLDYGMGGVRGVGRWGEGRGKREVES